MNDTYYDGRCICIPCWRATESFHMFYKEIELAHSVKLEAVKQEDSLQTNDPNHLTDLDPPDWECGTLEKLNEVFVKENHSESDNQQDTLSDSPGLSASEEESESESTLSLAKRTRSNRTAVAKRTTRSTGSEEMKTWLPGEGLTLCRCIQGVLEAQCHVCVRNKDSTAKPKAAEQPYMRFAKLMRHFREAHGTPGYAVCCNRKYARRRSLRAHMRTHGKVTVYHCHRCRIKFRKEESLNEHNNLVHLDDSEKQFRCEKCSKGFATEILLASHEDWHKNVEQRNIVCSDCNTFFPSIVAMHKHKSLHHPTVENADTAQSTNTTGTENQMEELLITTEYRMRLTAEEMAKQNELIERYCTLYCDVCQFVASGFADLKQHVSEEHGLRSVKVVCCDQPYTNRVRLYEHAQLHEDPDRFRCKVCSKRYVNSRSLQNHQWRIHTPAAERPFCCDVCGETFVKDYLLKKHLSFHLAKHQKLNFCEECNRSFATPAALRCHRQTYHGEVANWICEICAKGFDSRSMLDKHVPTHSAEGKTELKHQCERCKRWLRNKKSYQQHRVRCHMNAGPVKCPFCGKESKNSVALRAHIHLHHADRPEHACSFCEKRFKTALRLREHEATHTGTVLYKCPWCPRTFACGSNMYKHKKAGHPEEWAAGVQKRFGER
ncbi:zinc finger protein 91-like [Anopheles ziemanni]|uniref:zinc finger protein 91-like n=1 Tax=Anopheles ziemanni TaxID=345580 RepID=UPI00265F4A2D|nr:zinc finger protein 91-like [Anopheles ziemanni]